MYCSVKELIEGKSPVGVLIIDMQWKFLGKSDIPDHTLEVLVLEQKKVLDYCKVRDIPVFVIEYMDEGETIAELKNTLYEIPKKTRIIKQSDNAFIGTNLAWILRRMEIETLFVMGVASDACVKKTVIGAQAANFHTIVAKNTMHPITYGISKWYKKNAILTDDMFDTLAKQRI